MRKIKTRNLSFAIDIIGEGEPLIFIGGTGWDLRKKPNPLQSSLVDSFQVLLFDQRGMGLSDKPPGPYSMNDYAEDLDNIMTTLAWSSAHIAGYSFGGMVAQEFAIQYPDQVRSLSLISSAAGGKGGSSYPIHELLELPQKDIARRSLEIADTRFTPLWQQNNPIEAKKRIEKTKALSSMFMSETNAKDGLKAQLGARAKHDTFDRLNQIIAPTIVLAGTYDGQCLSSVQKKMAEHIPHATFKTIDGSHNMINENDQVYREIQSHIKDNL